MAKTEKSDTGLPLSPEKLYTAKQLAEALGLSELTIKRKAAQGELKAYKKFKKLYFYGAEVIEAIRDKRFK